MASATFSADIASSENLTRFMGYNSIAVIIAKGLAPAAGIKLMEGYGLPLPSGDCNCCRNCNGVTIFLIRCKH